MCIVTVEVCTVTVEVYMNIEMYWSEDKIGDVVCRQFAALRRS